MSAPWGSGVDGIGYWGEGNEDATVTFEAWGQGTWGSNAWGIGYVTDALSTNINSVSVLIDNDISCSVVNLGILLMSSRYLLIDLSLLSRITVLFIFNPFMIFIVNIFSVIPLKDNKDRSFL